MADAVHEEFARSSYKYPSGYLDALGQVTRFSIEMQQKDISVGETSLGTIDRETFLDELYVIQSEFCESQIHKHLQKSRYVACVVGPRGSGKTSALKWAVRMFENTDPDSRVVEIDVKALFEKREFDEMLTPENARLRFRKAIRDGIYSRLVDPDTATQILAWAIAGPPDESESYMPGLLDDFAMEYTSIAAMVDLADLDRAQRCQQRFRVGHFQRFGI